MKRWKILIFKEGIPTFKNETKTRQVVFFGVFSPCIGPIYVLHCWNFVNPHVQGEYSITQWDNHQDIGITPPHAAWAYNISPCCLYVPSMFPTHKKYPKNIILIKYLAKIYQMQKYKFVIFLIFLRKKISEKFKKNNLKMPKIGICYEYTTKAV